MLLLSQLWFLLFSCLIVLNRTFILCWIKETIVRIFYSLSVLEEMLTSLSSLNIIFAMYCHVWTCWGIFSLYPLCWQVYLKWFLNFVKWFVCLYCDHKILFFIMLVIHVSYLHLLNHLCIPERSLGHDVWIFLMYCWTRCSVFCLRFYKKYVHQWYWPGIFFFCGVCFILVSGWCWPSQMS